MRRIRPVVILGTAALALAGVTAVTGAAAATVAPAAACQPWDGVQPSTGTINAVATTSCDAWLVGSTDDPSTTFTEYWNGQDWTSPSVPAEPGESQLSGVSATSAGNAWAVGFFAARRTSNFFRTLILQWDGQSWAQVPSPQGDPSRLNQLTAVAATSASNAWAVGTYDNGHAHQTLILHWNGRTWNRQPSPDPGGGSRFNTLTAVAATSGTNAWAVGSANIRMADGLLFVRSFLLHWDGQTWTRVSDGLDPAHDAGLVSVTATSASNAWAVGSEGALGQIDRTVVVHWNGRAWRRQSSPNQPGPRPGHPSNFLFSVAATSATNAWAVGYFNDPSGPGESLVLHWNGRAWLRVSSPNPLPQFSLLTAVAAGSAGSAWAAGNGFLLHWNGTTWQQ
jgi:hypothetical protein